MIFMGYLLDPSRKKKKRKGKLTPAEKERRFISIGSKFCTLLVCVLAVVLGTINTFKGNDGDATNYLQPSEALVSIFETTDLTKIVDDPISIDGKDAMVSKIKSVGLDILENNNPNYDKFMEETIALNKDVNFSSQEIALMYSYTFMNNPDSYNMNIHQLSLRQSGENVSLYMVSTLNFYKLFTKHVKNNYDEASLDKFPKKIYVVNECTLVNGIWTYSKVRYNNLDATKSDEINELLHTTTPNLKPDEYVPNLIINYLNALSEKTNSTLTYVDGGIELKLNNSN